MSDIPEDIWTTIERTFPFHVFVNGILIEAALNASKQAMAKAIMAERQRCAGIVNEWNQHKNPYESGLKAIASAIMGEEK